MRSRATRESGFIMFLLLFAIVLAGAIGAGWWAWHRHQHQAITVPTLAVTSAPTCQAQDVVLSQGTADGTAGTIYKHAVITNTGSHKCTLAGYPAAFLLDSHGAVLGGGAADNPLYSPVSLTLSAGAKAHSVLGFPEAGSFDPGVCSAASTSLQLYLPGSVTPITTTWNGHSCPGFSVTALQPGA